MERSLAHIEKVHNIRPIEGADFIEQIGVLGWNLIAKKGEFQDGDLCVYIEIDSLCPSDNEAFAFLEKKHYKVKTMKMKGTVSQGLALPISMLPSKKYEVGQDVTNILKITKIEEDYSNGEIDEEQKLKKKNAKFLKKPFIKFLMKYTVSRKVILYLISITNRIQKKFRKKKHGFPSWVIKTDETRIQNMPFILDSKETFTVTEKLDGTSATYTMRRKSSINKGKYDFLVCSRNVLQSTPDKKCYYDDNVYWEMAHKYNIEETLRKIMFDNGLEYITLQGEIIGESIQKNKYNIKGRDFYAFNLLISERGRLNSEQAKKTLEPFGIKFVPILDVDFKILPTIEKMVELADGTSVLYPTEREGLVFRNKDSSISFKAISNKFLLKYDNQDKCFS